MSLDKSKPYRGKFADWKKIPHPAPNTLGYYVAGVFVDHPVFAGRAGHTSMVVKEGKSGWIETYNSRYRLVGPERHF